MDMFFKISYPLIMRIDGKAIQEEILHSLGTNLTGKKVAFVQLCDDTVTDKFVKAKLKVAQRLGVEAKHIHLRPVTTEDASKGLFEVYQSGYDGVVIQLPLPDDIDTMTILSSIPKNLDIDLLNPESMHDFVEKKTSMVPPVAEAVRSILTKVAPDLTSKKITILGKGRLVGLSVASLFDRDAIPYSIFDKDSNEEEVRRALEGSDIVITGIGRAGLVTPDMIKEGALLIDAGTSEQSGILLGDIDPACYTKAKAYTPVPGGVGPITIATLFKNLQ